MGLKQRNRGGHGAQRLGCHAHFALNFALSFAVLFQAGERAPELLPGLDESLDIFSRYVKRHGHSASIDGLTFADCSALAVCSAWRRARDVAMTTASPSITTFPATVHTVDITTRLFSG